TVGNSPILDSLEAEGLVSFSDIRGKREVFRYVLIQSPKLKVKDLLVIAGSDKLGTEYGAFALSEKMGVSHHAVWAHGVIAHRDRLELTEADFVTSKEPDVKFRGFFINDEWPCYGNWTMEHFGGFNARMYDKVFELLLRLKGNYLWPAMWSSSFAWDGPGLASYELATEYGIFIGNSHHEPCLRAGEEYRQVRGPESEYGDAWSFLENEKGITKFWKDSLDERGGFDSVVTVGMRGEADSTILGANSTLKDNIDLLKSVITCQKKLLAETEAKFNKKFPKMLALYKEVEPFYYGDENTPGLIDWEGLDDVILMLCEDNHNYVRTLPGPKNKNHPGGFGMYYHVDYHGDPISYEWINSTPLATIREQMTRVYDYGVRDIWILNVGDLKHNEFPLSFFMNLAYDVRAFESEDFAAEYTEKTLAGLLGLKPGSDKAKEAAWILEETVRLNSMRRPEALNERVYSPYAYEEGARMLARVDELSKREAAFRASLTAEERDAWYSLSGFQTEGTVNLLRMHLNAGINNMYALMGLKQANVYGDKVTAAIERDRELKQEWAAFKDGEWKGMEMASHIGFTKWNDDGCKYPLRARVEPLDAPHLAVRRTDEVKLYDKVYGPPMTLVIEDFCFEGVDMVKIELNNTGNGLLNFNITAPSKGWLKVSETSGEIEDHKVITLSCDRSRLSLEREEETLKITGGDTTVMLKVYGRKLSEDTLSALPKNTVLEGPAGYVVPSVELTSDSTVVKILKDYGIWSGAVISADESKDCSFADYKIYSETDRELTGEFVFAPSAPLLGDGKLYFGLSVNGEEKRFVNTVADNYRPGVTWDRCWSEGALTHRHKATAPVVLKKGVNDIKVFFKDPGLVLLRIFVREGEKEAVYSYLGPKETYKV
ncbi:MAG: glycosyl hydrolase 115 family protein, partial [Lachnospiraceae bacterium]|nr:glycosyl hydrolase 115 family protein [Lachnospiraceae bacterium]